MGSSTKSRTEAERFADAKSLKNQLALFFKHRYQSSSAFAFLSGRALDPSPSLLNESREVASVSKQSLAKHRDSARWLALPQKSGGVLPMHLL
jgi:hypothetical protein